MGEWPVSVGPSSGEEHSPARCFLAALIIIMFAGVTRRMDCCDLILLLFQIRSNMSECELKNTVSFIEFY